MRFAEFLAGLKNPLDALKWALLAKVGTTRDSWMKSETALSKYRRARVVRQGIAKASRRRNRR